MKSKIEIRHVRRGLWSIAENGTITSYTRNKTDALTMARLIKQRNKAGNKYE